MSIPDPQQVFQAQDHDTQHLQLYQELHPTIVEALTNLGRQQVRSEGPALSEETINAVHDSPTKTCDCGSSTSDGKDATRNLVSSMEKQDTTGQSLSASSTTIAELPSNAMALEEWKRNVVSNQVRPALPSEGITSVDHYAQQTSIDETSPSDEETPGGRGGGELVERPSEPTQRSFARNASGGNTIYSQDDSANAVSSIAKQNTVGGSLNISSVTPAELPTITTACGELERNVVNVEAPPTLPSVNRVDHPVQQTCNDESSLSVEQESSWNVVSSLASSSRTGETLIASSTAPANVLEIDAKGRPWWKGVVAYQVWPMSFKDSNGDGIGDLPGIISKLDYLKDLGIDMIWLSPTYKSPLDDWGYDISDYEDMHDQFGSLSDIETLIREVHARDMRIILDLVITHTSDQHAWFKESAKSKDNSKADWYMWADKRLGNMIDSQVVEEPSNWRAAFGGSAWTHVAARDQYYIHLFLSSQPDLNWHNAEMREAVYQSAIKFWIDRGVDGFRLDTANRFCKNPEYPDVEVSVPGKWQPGSQHYINGPEMHKWLKEIRTKMDRDSEGKDLMIVGELPLTPYEDLLKYVHPDEKELSMVFDFDMVKLGNNDNPDEYAKHQVSNYMDRDDSFTLPNFKDALMKAQSLITDSGAWGTVFMENHDQPRSIARYATPEHKYWRKAGKLLALLQTTLSGTEFIYQGQEMGMLNMPENWGVSEFRDPDAKIYVEDYCNNYREIDPNARENAIHGVFKVGRDNSRTPMQWSAEANGGFTGSNPTWMKVNDNFSWLNVEAQKADVDSIWNFWRARIAIRKEYKELFMFGTFALYDHDNKQTFTYTKMAEDGQMALVILNFSNEELPLNTPQRHLLGHTYRMIASNVQEPKEKLQAWEGRVYIIRDGLESGEEGRVSEVQDRKVQSKAGWEVEF